MHCPKPNKFFRTLFSPCSEQTGLIQWIILIIVLLGLVIGLYLVQQRTNLLPKAFIGTSNPISGPITTVDADGDGFNDSQEAFMGTDPYASCPTSQSHNAWPVDVNNDRYITGADMSLMVPFVNGSSLYNKRYDLNQDNQITTADTTIIQGKMLSSCTPPVAKTAELYLATQSTVDVGKEFPVKIKLTTPTDAINLASSQIIFSSDFLEVTSITIDSAFTRQIEKFFDNQTGQISIIAGVNDPGIKGDLYHATIYMKAKKAGSGNLILQKTKSEVLRNSDSEDILNRSTPDVKTVVNALSPTPIPSPTPVPSPSGTPTACSPRPNVIRTTSMTSQGLQVTLAPGTNAGTPNNKITSVSFSQFSNATVTLAGKINKDPFSYTLNEREQTAGIMFFVNQQFLNQATNVDVTVVDNCGNYSLFFGGGVGAGWPTTIPTPQPTGPISTNEPGSQSCTLTNARWVAFANPALTSTTAGLQVEAIGNCTNKQVEFTIVEDDGLLGSDPINKAPDPVILVENPQQKNFAATAFWLTEFQEDGVFGTSYPPEYIYSAKLSGETTIISMSGNPLQVLREVGTPSPVKGDVNGDGKANLKDISHLLANWNNPGIPSDLLDINQDGELNGFDFSELISTLKQIGVLRL